MKEIVKTVWKCNYCDDTVISSSAERHQMDRCECGRSSYDLEDGYARVSGCISAIHTEILDLEGNVKETIMYCPSCHNILPDHKLTCMYNVNSPLKISL